MTVMGVHAYVWITNQLTMSSLKGGISRGGPELIKEKLEPSWREIWNCRATPADSEEANSFVINSQGRGGPMDMTRTWVWPLGAVNGSQLTASKKVGTSDIQLYMREFCHHLRELGNRVFARFASKWECSQSPPWSQPCETLSRKPSWDCVGILAHRNCEIT